MLMLKYSLLKMSVCEQPSCPFAVGDILKWEPIWSVHPHIVWRNVHDDPLARNLERLFPLCLLWLAIWKYLLSIKNEKIVLFKSQNFSPVYQKYLCGCYSPSKRTLFFRIPAHSLVGLQVPCHPTPCLHFVLISKSCALKWFISCKLLTHAFFHADD